MRELAPASYIHQVDETLTLAQHLIIPLLDQRPAGRLIPNRKTIDRPLRSRQGRRGPVHQRHARGDRYASPSPLAPRFTTSTLHTRINLTPSSFRPHSPRPLHNPTLPQPLRLALHPPATRRRNRPIQTRPRSQRRGLETARRLAPADDQMVDRHRLPKPKARDTGFEVTSKSAYKTRCVHAHE